MPVDVAAVDEALLFLDPPINKRDILLAKDTFFVTDVNEAVSALSETGVEDLGVVLLTSWLEMALRLSVARVTFNSTG